MSEHKDHDHPPHRDVSSDPAARTLLAISPTTTTALELLRHRLRVVRGRAILQCLAHADKPWARAAIEQGAPHALAYILPE